jgi:hypothetical protein
MQRSKKIQKNNIIIEPYMSEITALRDQMTFYRFQNNKPYSFDYNFKLDFEKIKRSIDRQLAENENQKISQAVLNRIPVFLPIQTKRLTFFSYAAKSVRSVQIEELEKLLWQQVSKKYPYETFSEQQRRVDEDLKTFRRYHARYNFDEYRRDIFSTAVQFNAYDEKDNLLLKKAAVRGGLVFGVSYDVLNEIISVTYPRHRKQRSDKKTDYLPLKLIKIRGLQQSDSSEDE